MDCGRAESGDQTVMEFPVTETPGGDRRARCIALEYKHVHDVYNNTAHYFRDVRYKAWPKVRQFLMELEPGALVADVGCGSGKYLHINKHIFKVGCDHSSLLVDIARGRHHEVMTADNLRLPYRDNVFDAVISIGVIHHLTTKERRVQALRELARILCPGGKLMVYVWALEQRHRKFEAQDVLIPWHLQPKQKLKKETTRSVLDHKTLSVSSFSDDEGALKPRRSRSPCEKRTRRRSSGYRPTQVDKCRTLKHEELGSLACDCQQRRRSYQKQKHVTSSHSRDGDTSSCASNNTSMDVETLRCPGKNSAITRSAEPEKSGFKSRIMNFFTGAFSREMSRSLPTKKSSNKMKDSEYRRLIQQIMREDIELFIFQRHLLEHSMSVPETELAFAVREFPQSSQLVQRKGRSLDIEPGSSLNQTKVSHVRSDTVDSSCSGVDLEMDRNKSDLSQSNQSKPAIVQSSACPGIELLHSSSKSKSEIDVSVSRVDQVTRTTTCQPQQYSHSLEAVIHSGNVLDPGVLSHPRTGTITGVKGVHSSTPASPLGVGGIAYSSTPALPSAVWGAHSLHPVPPSKVGGTNITPQKPQSWNGGAPSSPLAPPTRPGTPCHRALTVGLTNGDTGIHHHDSQQTHITDNNISKGGLNGSIDSECIEASVGKSADVKRPIDRISKTSWNHYNREAIHGAVVDVQNPVCVTTNGTSLQQSQPNGIQQDYEQGPLSSGHVMTDVCSPAASDSSPDQCLCPPPDGSGPEGSSLSSPDDGVYLVDSAKVLTNGVGADGAGEVAFPESDTDEWAKVTVKAIQAMQIHMLHQEGGSLDSNTSLQAVVGSSLDLEDVMTDDDPGSPRWMDLRVHGAQVSRSRFSHGSDGSSLSSDTFPDSEDSETPPSGSSEGTKVKNKLRALNDTLEMKRKVFKRFDVVTSQKPMLKKLEDLKETKLNQSKGVSMETEVKDRSERSRVVPSFEQSRDLMTSTEYEPTVIPTHKPDKSSRPSQAEWDAAETTYHRYYHVFREGELISLIGRHVSSLHITESYYDNANWSVVAEKL